MDNMATMVLSSGSRVLQRGCIIFKPMRACSKARSGGPFVPKIVVEGLRLSEAHDF